VTHARPECDGARTFSLLFEYLSKDITFNPWMNSEQIHAKPVKIRLFKGSRFKNLVHLAHTMSGHRRIKSHGAKCAVLKALR